MHDREQWPEAFAREFICSSVDLRPRLQSIMIDGETKASDHQPMMVALN